MSPNSYDLNGKVINAWLRLNLLTNLTRISLVEQHFFDRAVLFLSKIHRKNLKLTNFSEFIHLERKEFSFSTRRFVLYFNYHTQTHTHTLFRWHSYNFKLGIVTQGTSALGQNCFSTFSKHVLPFEPEPLWCGGANGFQRRFSFRLGGGCGGSATSILQARSLCRVRTICRIN